LYILQVYSDVQKLKASGSDGGMKCP